MDDQRSQVTGCRTWNRFGEAEEGAGFGGKSGGLT